MCSATTRPVLDRPISLEEAAVIRSALERAPELLEVSPFADRIDHLHVVSRCGCGCDSVDFREYDPAHPSRIIARGIGTTPAGGQVGVLVWATEDTITGLEVSDLGAGDEDTKLPVPDSILPWPPQERLTSRSS